MPHLVYSDSDSGTAVSSAAGAGAAVATRVIRIPPYLVLAIIVMFPSRYLMWRFARPFISSNHPVFIFFGIFRHKISGSSRFHLLKSILKWTERFKNKIVAHLFRARLNEGRN